MKPRNRLPHLGSNNQEKESVPTKWIGGGIVMVRRSLPKILRAMLLSACLTSHGEEWISEDAGVSFQVPHHPDWSQTKGPRSEAKLTFARLDGQAAVVFITFQRRPDEILNEEFVKKWEKSFYTKGRSVKISGEFFTFKERLAYKLIDKRTEEEAVVMRTVVLWLYGDKVLEIAATKRNSDPLMDPVIKEFVDSMKFVSKAGSGAAKPQGGTNENKPVRSETNQTSAAAASPRSN